MRLHRLRVTAFGPFAGTVEVDLDEVAAGGLFLIRGATGAGKTSLLDAVAFALYADVPGARSKKGLHSDHADRGTVPEVSLDFTAAGRHLRIDRSPEFARPKARGSGEVKVPAKAVLWEHRAGSWQALSTRHDEIADVVKDVLGMGLEQFSKVVLLPQGDFAAFLRATPDERRALLERLFDISAFAGIEAWFAEQRKTSSAALQSEQAALAADLGVLAEVLAEAPVPLGDAELGQDWSEVAVEALPGVLATVHSTLEAAVVQALTTLDEARGADTMATSALTAAQETSARRDRGLLAQRRQVALTAAHDVQVSRLATIEGAERAASVRGDLTALDRGKRTSAAADRVLEQTRARVSRWESAEGGPSIDALRESLLTGAGTLLEADRARASLARRRAGRVEQAHGLERARERLESVAERLALATVAHEGLAQRLVRAKAAEATIEPVAARLAALTERHRLTVACEHTAGQVDLLGTRIQFERTTAQDLREVYQDLRQARLDGMAAELAGRLMDDEPCPVCGSPEHPAPATHGAAVTAEQVATAEEQWQQAAARVGAAEQELAALEAAQSERLSVLGAQDRSSAVLAQERAALETELHDLRTRAGDVESAQAAVEGGVATVEALEIELASCRDTTTTAASALGVLDDEIEVDRRALRAAVDAHTDTCPCVEVRTPLTDVDETALELIGARHRDATAALEAHAVALEESARAAAELEDLTTSTTQALAAAGFATVDTARAAVLPAPEVTELRALARAHEQAVVETRTVLEDPEIASAVRHDPPDLESLALRHEQARVAYQSAVSADTLLRRTLTGLDRIRTTVVARCTTLDEALTRHAVLAELADTITGASANNTLRMRLSAFVLAARLEKVAVLANERLSTMGEGRYQLRHSDDLAARGARSGLGLEVLDVWTGQTRDTSSLSGGESFMASLALALGLADAVREESGGFDLQTLFVDEGFGTLDDESLEQVMSVLDDLREGGRAVGVVSHVAELRSRIPSQVVVSKTERGSTVRVTTTAESAPAA